MLTPRQLEDIVASAIERATANRNGERKVWLDASELADYLGFTEKTIHNRTGPNVDNPIPCHRLTAGGEKRFHVDEVDEWLRRT